MFEVLILIFIVVMIFVVYKGKYLLSFFKKKSFHDDNELIQLDELAIIQLVSDFDAAQTEFEISLKTRNFDSAVLKMEKVIDNHPDSKKMFFANATLCKAYMGLAMQYFPGAEFREIQDLKNENGKKYRQRLKRSLKYSNTCLKLWETESFIDDFFGLTLEIDDYHYIKEIKKKVKFRLNKS